MSLEALAGEFAGHRSHLIAVAYRLTGSLADAEDAVQEAWLRLSTLPRQRREEIKDLRAWLTTVVGRLGLNRLRSATARREQYVGEWLPEPIVTTIDTSLGQDPLDAVVRDDGVRMAAMVVLDRLTPQQRVAFVLHDAFGVDFAEIAEILGCTPQAARQHASRGRRAAAEAEPPPRATLEQQREVLERFMTAVLAGDVHAVARVLHPDVVLIGDSDGKGRTTRRIMVGAGKLVRFFDGLRRMYPPDAFDAVRAVLVNGDLGMYLPARPGGEHHPDIDEHVQAIAVRDGLIVAMYDIVNPDKLRHLPASLSR